MSFIAAPVLEGQHGPCQVKKSGGRPKEFLKTAARDRTKRRSDHVLVLGHTDGPHAGATIRATYDCEGFGPADYPNREIHPKLRAVEQEIEVYLSSHWQVHERFKVFATPLAKDGSLAPIVRKVERFASGVAAKSIGADYVPGLKKILVTLGYREDEAPYDVRLSWVSLSDSDPEQIERRLCSLGYERGDVICHDLYEAPGGRTTLLLLTLGPMVRRRRGS